MIGRWNEEIVRLLSNWALWLAHDRNPGITANCIYSLGVRGPRHGNTIPILTGEAEDVDKVIERLPVRYQHPLRMHYCWPGRSDRSKASACSCSLNTYKTRLNEAHLLFSQGWYARRPASPRAA